MKPGLISMSAVGVLTALALAVGPAAQEQSATQHEKPQPPRYVVTDLGVLKAGNNGSGFGINNSGWVAGSSNLTVNGPQHAFLWYGDGPLRDLGTLNPLTCPFCNSAADTPNARGETPIGSETAKLDPNGEDFGGFGTHRQFVGAIWKNGVLKRLPTLPRGNNANAFGINNQGQVVGFAETGKSDPVCGGGAYAMPFQVLNFAAVIWGPDGKIQKLPPLKDDTVAFAWGINDKGQSVGGSGSCANTSLPPVNPGAPHAVLWERDGSPIDLGSLGGSYNLASAVNNQSEVVGAALSPEDETIHAFLWTKHTGMQDLGAFPGAVVTVAPCCNTINNRGDIVGFSIDEGGNMRALIWQGKIPIDLNTFTQRRSPLYLLTAESINDAGEITGQGVTPSGELHAFLATPR